MPNVSRDLISRSLVEAGLRRGGGRDAIVDSRRRLTFSNVGERTARLANCLLALGCTPDRPVAALLGNCSEYLEVDIAATRAGVPRVGLGDRLSPDEWRYLLADSQAAVLVTSSEFEERLLWPLPDTVDAVLIVDSGTTRRDRQLTCRDYEAALADSSRTLNSDPINPDSPNYILYTSGTTGRPKGAWHSHASRVSAALNMLAFELTATRTSAMVHAGPLTHGSGSKALAFFAVGAKNIILERFDVEAFAAAVCDEGGTHTFLVPTMIQRLMSADANQVARLRGLKQISYGGSPIAPTLFRSAVEFLGPRFVQVYGSCEAPHPVTLLRPEDYAEDLTDEILASAGVQSPGVAIRLVDAEGKVVIGGDVGELQVLAPQVMSGYWNKPQETADVLTAAGWYATGDLASITDGGFVTFRDRKKDLIISGGLNIYPSEVERVLAAHPKVAQVAVVGAPDDEWGESVRAFVVPAEDGVTADELTLWMKDRLASYKKPRAYEFRSALPTGSSHKVLRKQLRDELWADRNRRVN